MINIIENIRSACFGNELLSLTILIFSGILFGFLMEKIKLPEVTGYILCGILLGASGINLFSEHFLASLQTINHIALGLMTLSIGTHVNFHRLKNSGKRVLSCFLGETIFTFAIVLFVFVFIFSKSLIFAFLISAVSISTAPATTVAVVKETKARGTLINTLMPVVAINNAFCIILFGIFMSVSKMIFTAKSNGHGIFYEVISESIVDLSMSFLLGSFLGFILTLYAQKRAKGDAELLTIVFLTVIATIGLSGTLSINPMLPCLVIGIFISNVTTRHKRIIDVLEGVQHLIILIFFAMAGMHFDAAHLGTVGLMGTGYFLARGAGKILGASIGASLSSSPNRVSRNIGFTLLPQAGVAIGLIMLASQVPHSVDYIDLLITIVLASVTINEILGPPLTKWAIIKAGEANQNIPKLIEFIGEEYINPDLKASNKTEVIAEMVKFLIKSHNMDNEDYNKLLEAVLKREDQMSTGIGDGVAVPHGIIDIKEAPYIWGSIGISKKGINFNSYDNQKVHIIILVITPEEHREKHVKVMAEISSMLNKNYIRKAIINTQTAAELFEILREQEIQYINYFIDE